MSEKLKELQARLTEVSPRDYSGCLALFQEVLPYSKSVKRGTREFMDVTELARRTERLFTQAVTAAQLRGEIRIAGQSRGVIPAQAVPYPHVLSECRLFEAASDDIFELALKNARARGSLGRSVLNEELRSLTPKADPVQVKAHRLGTLRGKRTIEHMAIQINALAMGTGDIKPEEVPGEMVEEMVTGIFRDIGTIRSFLRKVVNSEAV